MLLRGHRSAVGQAIDVADRNPFALLQPAGDFRLVADRTARASTSRARTTPCSTINTRATPA